MDEKLAYPPRTTTNYLPPPPFEPHTTAGQEPSALLVDIFEPSSPRRPRHNDVNPRRHSWVNDTTVNNCTQCRKSFSLILRRHHCRRCGLIFCYDCCNNRITNLKGPTDTNYYRLCDGCIDDLVETEQARIVPNDRNNCAVLFSMPFRKVAAIIVTGHSEDILNSLPENLLRFDEQVVTQRSTGMETSLPPVLFASPIVSAGSTPTRENLFTRCASVVRSLPTRMRSSSTPSESSMSEAMQENIFESCPVCSISFQKWTPKETQFHIEKCIISTESRGTVMGDRYSIHTWTKALEGRECSICFEDFTDGQKIAVLNCLCQFHVKCIDAWFERGKCCPFHAG